MPAADWEWVRLTPASSGHQIYSCRRIDDPVFSNFTIAVFPPDGVPHDAEEFIRGSVAQAEAKGWKVRDVTRDPTDIPLPGWVRYSFRTDPTATGPTCILEGYVGTDGARRTIALTHLAAATSEPPEFAAFVKSFRLYGVKPFTGGGEI
jgi:hypothetical protein